MKIHVSPLFRKSLNLSAVNFSDTKVGWLNATWNSVKQRALAWSLSRSHGRSHGSLHNIHYTRVTARDSIEHAKKSFWEVS